MNKNRSIFILISLLMVMLMASCSAKKDQTVRNEGNLTGTNNKPVTLEYTRNSDEPFFASIDLELKSGKVDWELINPDGKTAYTGFAAYEDGKTYRQLTLPPDFLKGIMSQREEVKDGPDFNYLQFQTLPIKGAYKLILKPSGADGKYLVEWHDKLPRK